MEPSRSFQGRLPTTLGYAPLDDRARLPGRFFYRQISAVYRTA